MAEDRPDDARLRFGLAVELLNRGETREGAGALKAYRRGIEIAEGRGHGGLVEELEEAMEDLS